jgi:hypothetical protein
MVAAKGTAPVVNGDLRPCRFDVVRLIVKG